MKCFIDGREIKTNRIGPPAMNFGQSEMFKGCKASFYRYVFDLDEFIKLLNPWLKDFIQEESSLVGIENNEEFPQLKRFRELGFPGLSSLARDHQKLLYELIKFDEQEVLGLLGKSPPIAEVPLIKAIFNRIRKFFYRREQNIQYSANSIDLLVIESSTVVMEGVVYAIEKNGGPAP